MASDNPSPTGMMAWAGFGCAIFGLACLCIAFASPYWLQTYPNSFNTFRNIGMWEICMNNYMHHKDDSQEIYNGCWWVFNREKKYWKLREWLLPPWFIICQVMIIANLIISLISIATIAFCFLHLCPILNHEYYQTYAMFGASAMCFLNALLSGFCLLIFGIFSQSWEWMPRPDMNYYSWGFGFYVIYCFAVIGAGVTCFLEAKKVYTELLRQEDEFAKMTLEMSGYPTTMGSMASYPPGYNTSYGQSSYKDPQGYGPEYGSQSGYPPSQSGYNNQEKGYYPDPGYQQEKQGADKGYVSDMYGQQPPAAPQYGYA